ncbi:MAG TPA: RsmB/NOP family class I SAM-dependent RNA methyltransferase [Myxococcota bacterium]|nr:RsmB/NOP family class I SAM-dependent RNA methyltransferase [Myxococcota bacterium]
MNNLAGMAECYRRQYGQETEALFKALERPFKKIALINPFLKRERLLSIIGEAEPHKILGLTFYHLPQEEKPRLIDGLLSHYFMDASSVLAPMLLPLEPNMRVLDMCAAPGGKLLVMISRMITGLSFVASDISRARSERLRRVLREFLPGEYLRRQVNVRTEDALRFGLKEPSTYDAILLDAPCSSEGHVVKDPALLAKFSGLKKSLPMRQYALLASALLALKPGGHVLYATCSINLNENDMVIKRIVERKISMCQLVPMPALLGEKTKFGIAVLPHRHHAGPAYLCLLKRL